MAQAHSLVSVLWGYCRADTDSVSRETSWRAVGLVGLGGPLAGGQGEPSGVCVPGLS